MRYRLALLLCALSGALFVAGCDRPGAGPSGAKPTFRSIDITGAEYARKLELPDADGRLRTLSDFKGQVVVVFFGYTRADVSDRCRVGGPARWWRRPTPAGVFVTVDDRDTAAVLKSYVENFGAGFAGLRGTAEQTQQVAREFKVFYAKAPGKTETSYTVDHTAGAYIFDTQGRVRLYSRYGAGPKALEEDVRALLRERAG
jgi:protein SCO1/2